MERGEKECSNGKRRVVTFDMGEMKKLYIAITTVLEKEQIDRFSLFIVVKKIILHLLKENFIISMT